MSKARRYEWHPWTAVGNLLLAALVGLIIALLFAFIGIGWMTTVVCVTIALALIGLGHYFVWGRSMPMETAGFRRASFTYAPREGPYPFVVELDDAERAELIEMLEESLATRPALNGSGAAQGATPQTHKAAVQRALLEKIRLYGAGSPPDWGTP